MTGKFTPSYMAQGMNEIPMVQILKPVLIQVMGIGAPEEVMSGRIFHAFFIMSILGRKDWNM